ncbi:MAG: hypothetical protein EXR21_09270 [Flavobacteriaceae bacterium]|nr:hypothetical protein [Flavobacteriaceae bacterium]
MKKANLKTAMTLFVISLLSSCAMHQGYMVNSAALSSNNFTYVYKDLKGTAMVTYVFGIFGGLDKMALVNAAKKDLLSKSPLRDNQALVNLTVNWKATFVLPFAITNRCTVTADIVEFRKVY